MDVMLDVEKNELLFIYNSNKLRDRRALGYAKALKDYKLKEIDLSKEKLTGQQFMDLTYRLKVPPLDLFDKQADTFMQNLKGVKLSKEDILKTVKHTPSVVKTPIAVFYNKAYFVSSAYDFVKQGLEVEGINPEVDELNRDPSKQSG